MSNPQIVISLTQRKLYLITKEGLQFVFPVAIGKPETPTPKGTWRIQNKKILSDSTAFGTHWLGLNMPGYGLHGTDKPEFIGKAVSAGCIRMYNQDIQYLFQQVAIGTSVIIND